MATLLDIVVGTAIAWLLVRSTVRGRGLLDALAMMPLAVPGLVMAFGFIAVLLQLGIGEILRTGPFWVLVIAYAVRRLPYLVRSAAGGLQQTSVTLEEAAANLGAGPWRVLMRITVPLILANSHRRQPADVFLCNDRSERFADPWRSSPAIIRSPK